MKKFVYTCIQSEVFIQGIFWVNYQHFVKGNNLVGG